MKRKSLLFALLLAFIAPWAANGQNRATVTIGTGTSTGSYPLPGWYGWNYEVYLYTPTAAQELGVDSDISSLAFNVSSNSTTTGAEMYIWVKDVDANYALAAATTFDDYISGATQVYSNANFTSTTGWNTYNFSSTFSHEGGKALLVAVRGVGCSTSGGCSRQCYYTSASNTSWNKRKDSSDPGQTVAGSLSSNRANIQLELTYTGAVCFAPSGMTYSNVTDNAANLSWNESGSSTAWTLEYGTASDYTGATQVPVSGTPSTPLSNLSALTTYYVRVKADCGSDWLEGSFTTTARATAVGDAWSDDFEGNSCGWDLINGTLTNKWCWGTAASNGGTHGLYVSNDNGTTNAYTNSSAAMTFATMFLGFTEGKYEFSYDWICNGESTYDYLRVALVPASVTLTAGTTPSSFSYNGLPSGWIALDGGSKLNGVTSWQSKSLAINVAAGNYYLVMAWKDDTSGGSNPPAAVDNVSITKIACDYDVTGLDVDNITTTTADVTWTDSEVGEWQVALKEGNGEWAILPDTYTTNSAPLTGLTAATNYQVRVRAYCNANDQGSWCEAFSFTTACEVIAALGYSENFDGITLPSVYTPSSRTLPVCWSYINETTYTSSGYMYYPTMYYYSYTDYSHSSPNSLRFYSSYNSYTDYDPQPQYAILPEMTGLAGMQVTLMARGQNAQSTFKIGTMSDPTDASTFTLIAEQTGLTTSYPEEPFEYLIPRDCQDSYLAIMIDAATSSRSTNGVYIDDIVIREAPTCTKPTELAVTEGSITSSGATITWTAGDDETQWQIEFATDADFTNPLYETVNADPDDEAYVPTYTFHGLADATTYYVHVQAVCGGSNGSSEYSNIKSFTTLQTAVNLPYATDFESGNDWLLVNGELTNAWAYGTANNNGGTHAIYISNDGGTTNAYDNNSTMVYATKLFNFEAGIYVFSYDWIANGESSWDYLRVALVPSSVQLAAATSYPNGFGSTSLPTGWIALDGGGKLNLQQEWQSFATNEMEIAAGTYMMVFAWRNDGSTNNNPPAAIDNVSIAKITCTTPADLEAPQSGITATSAQLSWTETGEATAWEIELTDEEDHVTTIPVDEEDLVEGVYTIRDLSPETVYSVRVRANCGDGYSNWSEEEIFETAEDCQTPDGLAATTTSNSATISWNGYGQEEFNLRYSTDGETWTTEPRVTNNYTLADLTPATTYYVQVQPTCADEETWSVEYSFTTECVAQTITATEPFTEGFEEITGTHIYSETNGIVPTCWDSYSEGSVYPHMINSGSYYYHHNGTGTMYFKGEASTNSYLALPLFTNDLSTLMVSFWMATESSSNGTLSLGYITDADVDYNSYQVIKTYNNTTTNTSMVQCQTFVGSNTIPSNATRLVFRWQYTGTSWYGVCIDDVTVEIAPSYTKTIAPYTSDGGYYLIASPLADAVDPTTVGMITDDWGADAPTPADCTYDFFAFDQGQELEWVNYRGNAFSMVNGQGYLYASKEGTTITFIGMPYSGEGIVTLDRTDDDEADFQGWNLVGNPFAEEAYVDRPFYVMDANGAEIIAETNVTRAIQPMEGIFVTAEQDGETMTFTTEAPGAKANLVLNITQGRSNTIDRAIISVGQGRTLPKFMLNPGNTKLYIPQNGEDYAVVCSRISDEIPVSFEPAENGLYTISVDVRNMNLRSLLLKDKVRNVTIDLLRTPSYQFKARTEDRADRFMLSFRTSTSIYKEKVVKGANSEDFGFFSYGNWVIDNEGEATLQVIDLNGRVISTENIYGSTSIQVDAAPGVYMLRLINGNDVKTQKVVVR